MKSACPWPAGDHSTRQWLTRSGIVLPPSFDRRTNEFSPVITGSWGSTSLGSAIVSFPLLCTLDDANVALRPVAKRAQGLFVRRAFIGRDRLVEAWPLAHHGSLVETTLERLRRGAAHDELATHRLDRGAGELRVSREFLRILDLAISHHPIGLGHRTAPWRSEERRVGKECRSRWSAYH